jgi:hypothetical protein
MRRVAPRNGRTAPRTSARTRTAVLAALAALMLAAPAAASAADDMNAPTPLPFNQSALGDSRTATIQGGEPMTDLSPNDFCPGTPDVAANRTLWWTFRGTGGPIRITTSGSLSFAPDIFDTVLGVYQGSGIPGATAVGCNDDDPATGSVTSGFVVNTLPGVQYLVQVGACDGSAGAAPATTTCGTASQDGIYNVAAITNDDPAQAQPVATGATVGGTNRGTTVAAGENTGCDGAAFGKTVWYGWAAPGAGTGTVTVSGAASMAPVVALYRDGVFVSCALAPAGSGTAQLRAPVTAGGYQIQVGGRGTGINGESDFTISSTFTAAPPPAPSPDRDRDGALNAADCAPDDARIHPGAQDTPGDGIDQDCSGADARLALVSSRPRANWLFFRRYTRLTRLVALNVSPGMRIEVRCAGRGCPIKRPQVTRITKTRTSVSLLGRKLRRAHLRPGTTIEVRISRAGFITRVTRFRFVRLRRDPVQQTLCLAPGATKAGRCA